MHYCLVVALIAILPAAQSIKCYACSGLSCDNNDEWHMEDCPWVDRFCYQFVEEGRVYHRGCLNDLCSEAPGFVPGHDCRRCEDDYCNGEKIGWQGAGGNGGWGGSGGGNSNPNRETSGGGTQWNAAVQTSNVTPALLFVAVTIGLLQ